MFILFRFSIKRSFPERLGITKVGEREKGQPVRCPSSYSTSGERGGQIYEESVSHDGENKHVPGDGLPSGEKRMKSATYHIRSNKRSGKNIKIQAWPSAKPLPYHENLSKSPCHDSLSHETELAEAQEAGP